MKKVADTPSERDLLVAEIRTLLDDGHATDATLRLARAALRIKQ